MRSPRSKPLSERELDSFDGKDGSPRKETSLLCFFVSMTEDKIQVEFEAGAV